MSKEYTCPGVPTVIQADDKAAESGALLSSVWMTGSAVGTLMFPVRKQRHLMTTHDRSGTDCTGDQDKVQ